VRLALLSLLADEPMHGYQLMRRLEERSGGIYRATARLLLAVVAMSPKSDVTGIALGVVVEAPVDA